MAELHRAARFRPFSGKTHHRPFPARECKRPRYAQGASAVHRGRAAAAAFPGRDRTPWKRKRFIRSAVSTALPGHGNAHGSLRNGISPPAPGVAGSHSSLLFRAVGIINGWMTHAGDTWGKCRIKDQGIRKRPPSRLRRPSFLIALSPTIPQRALDHLHTVDHKASDPR